MSLSLRAVDTELWSFEKFFDTKPCPNQRNTVERAAKANARGGHLVKPSPTHAIVNVARVEIRKKEVFYKLDGHTRSHLWKTEKLALPSKKLTVNIIDCVSLEDVCGIYDQYDSVSSSKNTQDQIFGLMAKHGFTSQSEALKKPKLSSFFKFAYSSHRRDQVEERLIIILPYLKIIDAKLWPKKNMGSSEFCALLACLIIMGSDSLPFWTDYIEGVDYISKGEQSAVTAFRNQYRNLKDIGQVQGTNGVQEVMRFAIPAVRHHINGHKYKTGTKIKRLNEKDFREFREELGHSVSYEGSQVDFIS